MGKTSTTRPSGYSLKVDTPSGIALAGIALAGHGKTVSPASMREQIMSGSLRIAFRQAIAAAASLARQALIARSHSIAYMGKMTVQIWRACPGA